MYVGDAAFALTLEFLSLVAFWNLLGTREAWMAVVRKRNKVDEVSFIGGLIGFLFVNPRAIIDSRVSEANNHGWTLVAFQKSSGNNLLINVLRFVLLVVTLGLFTFGDGMYLVFEKETAEGEE